MIKKMFPTCCMFVLAGLFGWNTKFAYSVGAVQDGLVAYWSFDEDTVDIKKEAVDVFGGLVAVVLGDPELAKAADCKVGECILFDGDVDYLLVEEDPQNKINRNWDQITLECWAFINALDDSWNRIISLDDMPANKNVASLYYDDDDNRHNFWVRTPQGETDAVKDDIKGDIPLEKWLHLTGTYDGSTVYYYINGKLANKYSMKGGSLKKGGLILGIGDRSDGCNCDAIQGYVDEFRIYDRALSAAEVANNFKAEGLAVHPNLGKLSLTWGYIRNLRHR